MNILKSIFGRSPDYKSAVEKAEMALRPQVKKLLTLNPEVSEEMEELNSQSTLYLLYGFITYYLRKYNLKKDEHKITATLRVFSSLFGEKAGIEMIQTLQVAMKNQENWQYFTEGENAAKHFEKEGLYLVEAFLEGSVNDWL